MLSPSARARAAAWLPLALLLLAFLALRLPGLGRFGTIDEVHWYRVAIAFRQELLAGNWAETAALSKHPAITTLWAGTLGTQLRFPDIDEFPQEEFTDFHLRHYFWRRGINPIEVIAAGRLFIVLFNAAAFALLWSPLRRLLGTAAAFLGMGLIALDPFLTAHQRLLHQDGLMASFGLLCLVYFAAYLDARRSSDLLLSAAGAALAWLTKSPMLLLGPVTGLAALWAQRRAALRPLLLWGAAAAAVFALLWPAMLSDPLAAVTGVVDYALGSAQGEFSGQIFFNGEIYSDGRLGWASWLFYPLSIAWRATPVLWLGLATAAWAALSAWRGAEPGERKLIGLLAFFSLAFFLFMTLAEKKFDRYILPAYAALFPLAGWGLARALARLRPAFGGAARWAPAAIAAGLLAAQAWSSAAVAPVFLNYYNLLLGGRAAAGEVMMLGWGEGLEQAAQYIRDQTRGQEPPHVGAWYSNLFNLFYGADVEDIPIAAELSPQLLEQLLSLDYLVIYVHQWQRGTPQNLLDALAPLEPNHSIWIGGQEYVRVYRLSD
ncbi:MAG: glycosyltransferase family 39 protein [Anaerolineales bacterium]|nr:glycosyltransferase family 39 protein [Anaerolineales bacterium]